MQNKNASIIAIFSNLISCLFILAFAFTGPVFMTRYFQLQFLNTIFVMFSKILTVSIFFETLFSYSSLFV